MNKKLHWASQMRQYLQDVSVAVFMLVSAMIFIVAGAVALTIMWWYTQD